MKLCHSDITMGQERESKSDICKLAQNTGPQREITVIRNLLVPLHMKITLNIKNKMNKKRDYVLDTQNMNGKSIKKKISFFIFQ